MDLDYLFMQRLLNWKVKNIEVLMLIFIHYKHIYIHNIVYIYRYMLPVRGYISLPVTCTYISNSIDELSSNYITIASIILNISIFSIEAENRLILKKNCNSDVDILKIDELLSNHRYILLSIDWYNFQSH
jgi:hypothetical protein